MALVLEVWGPRAPGEELRVGLGFRVCFFFFEGPFPTAGTARIPVLGGARV